MRPVGGDAAKGRGEVFVATGRAFGCAGRDEISGSGGEVTLIDVDRAVLVRRGEFFDGHEEHLVPVDGGPGEADVGGAAAARRCAVGGRSGDQRGDAAGQVADVDVQRGQLGVGGRQPLFGGEEDLGAVGGGPLEEGVSGGVSADRPGRELAGHVVAGFPHGGVKGPLVDVAAAVGVAGREFFRRCEEDDAPVGGGALIPRNRCARHRSGEGNGQGGRHGYQDRPWCHRRGHRWVIGRFWHLV